MPRPARHELFLTREFQADRAVGGDRQMTDDVLDQHLLLDAESPTDAGFDDSNLLHRQSEQWSDHTPHVERHLCRRGDDEPFVAVPRRDRNVGLDRCLLDLMDAHRLLEHAVGGREAVCDVSGLCFDVMNEVVGGVVRPFHVRLVVDDRCTIEDRLVLIEYRGEHFVRDVDQIDGGERDLLRVGGDGGNAVTDETDAVVEADLVVGERVRVALSARRVSNAGHVAVMDDGMHTRQFESSRVVDRDDPGIGVRAVEDLGDECAGQIDVVGERRIALDELDGIDLGLRFPDDAGLRDVAARHHTRSDGREIRPGCLWAVTVRQRVKEDHIDAFRRLAAQHGSGAQHGVHRAEIAGLAVENPGEGVSDLVLGWVWASSDQRLRCENRRRCRVARLNCTGLDECCLDRVKVAGAAEAFDRFDFVAVGLRREHQVGGDQGAVDEYGSCSGLAGLRPETDTVVSGLAEHRAQRIVRLAVEFDPGPIDCERDRHDDAPPVTAATTRSAST